jgi:hypothetical protein
MLAYLFWHVPKAEVERSEYESGLLSFSRGLARSGCEGLRCAHSFRISAMPWLDNREGYEDWTIVEGSGVLDTLNTVAVSGVMATPHARIAQSMEVGHGGLYYHLWGDAEVQTADGAQWLSRPRGIDFRPALEQITQSTEQLVSVWRRFMVLGPGLEFLVLGSHPLTLRIPPGWRAHGVRRRALASAS